LRKFTGSRPGLLWILAIGLIARLLFIGADGFANDVSSFESWSLTLSEHPLREFYSKAGFADYPPGYFLILCLVGHLYHVLIHADPQWSMLKIFVKLPSIFTDLGCGVLLFTIARRLTKSDRWGLAAAALFTLNPAMIFISAYWGQVDSVAAVLMLGAVALIVGSEDGRGERVVGKIALAWLLLAYSILIKPPAAVLLLLFFAYTFVARDNEQRRIRFLGASFGIVLSLCMVYAVTLLFHSDLNPIDQARWLFNRYLFASGVYPFNSVNAFNIYAVRWPFWQSDSARFFAVGSWSIPQNVLGIITVFVALLFILERYVHRRDTRSFVETALLLSLSFFMLATRMHERYIFNAVTLCIALCGVNRRYLYASLIFSGTLYANLLYSLWYLRVLTDHLKGYNPTDLFPWVTHPLSFLNVVLFFALAYLYMDAQAEGDFEAGLTRALNAACTKAWNYCSPVEGMMCTDFRDKLIACGFVIASIALTGILFWVPTEKIFDEIYYARAAEEYIRHVEIFEFTHPPLTKLIITVSTLLFGDNSFGWRLLNVVVGGLMVGMLYVFAKRLLGSTPFASIAALLLLLDGFHFTQSRIATPEIIVAFFSLTTLYAFYRFWLASRVRTAPWVNASLNMRELVFLAGATLFAALIAYFLAQHQFVTWLIAFLYFELGMYLAVRLLLPQFLRVPKFISYADGTTIVENLLHTPDGGVIDLKNATMKRGECTKTLKDTLLLEDGALRIAYEKTGTVRYATPQGEAVFFPDGTMRANGDVVRSGDGMFWLWALSISGGFLAASKWNGLFDFFVVWLLAAFVVVQPYLFRRRPALWGNPCGFSLDIITAAMLFVGATVYTLSYIPYFTLHHTLTDLIMLQKQMFGYHYDLHATHPYSSQWWQWPILQIPISYYYQDFRHGAAASSNTACCVAEILALPNPVSWWSGLFSVPLLAWWAYREHNKGYALLVTAYFFQWLPWILSPRIAFEYHFFPNLAIIVLADAVLLQRLWASARARVFSTVALPNILTAAFLAVLVAVPIMWVIPGGWVWADACAALTFVALFFVLWTFPRLTVAAYVACVLAAYIFWYPITAATPITWEAWNARMLTQIEGTNWINPHPGQ
jgi:Gpi18-like mannosyltransferase